MVGGVKNVSVAEVLDHESISSAAEATVVKALDGVPPLPQPAQISESIQESKKTDWKAVGIRALNFFAGAALGVLGGLALTGLMVSPVGWGIAAGALVIGLVGAYAYGGVDEFYRSFLVAFAGLDAGMAAVAGAGAVMIALANPQIWPTPAILIGCSAALTGLAGAITFDYMDPVVH